MNSVVPAGNNEVMLLFREDLLGEALNRYLHAAKTAYTAYFVVKRVTVAIQAKR